MANSLMILCHIILELRMHFLLFKDKPFGGFRNLFPPLKEHWTGKKTHAFFPVKCFPCPVFLPRQELLRQVQEAKAAASAAQQAAAQAREEAEEHAAAAAAVAGASTSVAEGAKYEKLGGFGGFWSFWRFEAFGTFGAFAGLELWRVSKWRFVLLEVESLWVGRGRRVW